MINDYKITLSHDISLLPWLENICKIFNVHSLGHTPIEGQEWALETSSLPKQGSIRTHLHFKTQKDSDQMSNFLTSQQITHKKTALKISPWQEYHQQFMSPISVGKLTILPVCTPEILAKDTLYFPAGLGFGTGHHETTQGCLLLMQQKSLKGQTILDFGSGSGILAVAAGLLGADKLYFDDIDPQAIAATKESLRKHQLDDKSAYKTDENIPNNLDMIISNILLTPLLEKASFFFEKLKKGGFLITSGVLAEQQEILETTYKKYFKVLEIENKNGWLSHLWIKR